jgi:hypothetical protein
LDLPSLHQQPVKSSRMSTGKNCPSCGSHLDFWQVFWSQGTWSAMRCPKCGTVSKYPERALFRAAISRGVCCMLCFFAIGSIFRLFQPDWPWQALGLVPPILVYILSKAITAQYLREHEILTSAYDELSTTERAPGDASLHDKQSAGRSPSLLVLLVCAIMAAGVTWIISAHLFK